jgi:hypothetical protein
MTLRLRAGRQARMGATVWSPFIGSGELTADSFQLERSAVCTASAWQINHILTRYDSLKNTLPPVFMNLVFGTTGATKRCRSSSTPK